jgi:hypothetical protein
MTIEAYVAELRRLLAAYPLLRRRALVEVEDHLREAAAEAGEEEAIRRFGSPEHVAAGLAPQLARQALGGAAVTLVLLAGGLLTAFMASENSLPPAPWPSAGDAPLFLRITGAGAVWAFAFAVVGGLVALVVRPARAAGLAAAGLALAIAAALLVAHELRRASIYEDLDVAGRLSALELAVGATYVAALCVLALAVSAGLLRVAWTASRASRS